LEVESKTSNKFGEIGIRDLFTTEEVDLETINKKDCLSTGLSRIACLIFFYIGQSKEGLYGC
jgi:hypothetical protein